MAASEVAYTLAPLPDPNDVVLDFLDEQFDEFDPGNLGIETPPAGLVGRLPYGLSHHFGGTITQWGGLFVVDVSVFAVGYPAARDLARSVEDRLLGYPFRVSSGGRSVLVDNVDASVPTVEVPWQEDSAIRRFQGTYTISIRRS